MSEIWKAVPGFEGSYEVSNMGRVRSLDRHVLDTMGRARIIRGRVLKGSLIEGRYRMIQLYRDAAYEARYVHDMVADAFVGPKPPGARTRHLDDNPSNNLPVNLKYGTQRENMDDAIRNDCFSYGEQHHNCVYPEAMIAELKAAKGYLTSPKAERKFGISARYIREIWAGEARTRK